MGVTLDQLACFVAVTRSGHFTRAADEVGIAQPSLSRQIAALEKDVGTRLFDRGAGTVTLTDAGEALLPVAIRMLEDRAEAYRQIAELNGLIKGRLRLGATPSLCISLVADVLSQFHAKYPGIELHLTEAGSRTLVTKLDQGELDLALVVAERTDKGSGLVLTPLLSEELVIVSSASKPPLTSHHSMTLAELANEELVACHDNYDLRVTVDHAFATAGLQTHTVVEGAELDAVLRFVAHGIGVSVAPMMAALHYPGLRITRLTAPQLTRTVSLAHRSNLAPTRVSAAFHALLDDAIAENTARAIASFSPASS
ncbi:LysR family transcriptional regulator [Rhodococcus sp. AG1013]|uniref:LysR family transcriptional regulator n=1 Tax=unclassified Rhodococcus (in: high G+C Gram-positive bacteria) TaxID=192944 RepID=UPI000E2C68CC|nr:LysR family transcriptional regulator [Rhodococcus sp. AG1013]RDI20453.1 DNA-binding transcriptional LysR family regulator [Rhodococcus sp. AG1013]